MRSTAWPIFAASLFLAVRAADAGQEGTIVFSDDEEKACAREIDSLRKTKAGHFSSPEVAAVRVNSAEHVLLDSCLEPLRRRAKEDRASKEIHDVSCPCSENGIDFDQDEAKACESVVLSLRRERIAPRHKGYDRTEFWSTQLRNCLETHRKAKASQDRSESMSRSAMETDARIEAAVHAAESDLVSLRIVHSAGLCEGAEGRAAAKTEIAKETAYAKRAGVINLSKLESLKNELRQNDEAIAAAKSGLKSHALKPMPCSSAEVALLRTCLDDFTSDDCRPEPIRVLRGLAVFLRSGVIPPSGVPPVVGQDGQSAP